MAVNDPETGLSPPDPVESLIPVDSGGKALYHNRIVQGGVLAVLVVMIGVVLQQVLFPTPPSRPAPKPVDEEESTPANVIEDPGSRPLVVDVPEEAIIPPEVKVEPVPEPVEPPLGLVGAEDSQPRVLDSDTLVGRTFDQNVTGTDAGTMDERRYDLIYDAILSPSTVPLTGYSAEPAVNIDPNEGRAVALYEGTAIPVLMTHSLSTDTPSPLIGVVSRDVVDRHGRVRVPRGSVLIGQLAGHQRDRILGLWTRIRFEDGRSADITALLTDREGRGGVEGTLYTGTVVQTLRALATATVAAGVAIATQASEPQYETIERPQILTRRNEETGETELETVTVPQVVQGPRDPDQIAGAVFAEHLSNLAAQQIQKIGAGDVVRVETRLGARAAAVLLEPLHVD